MYIRFLSVVFMLSTSAFAAPMYNLNVQVIQVCDDAGANCTPLGPSGGTGYLYETQVQEIWDQADLQITFLPPIIWNNTEAQRLTSAERSAIYDNTFTSASGDAIPALGVDAVQIFFVNDHPGTGYDGTSGSGWVGSPLPNPMTSARNAGNAQLYIDGTFSSNGRSVVANEGFTADSLSGTLPHEIGHLMGLRHVDDVNAGAAAGTTQDPAYPPVSMTDPNLMWAAGSGPSYDGGLDNSATLTVLQENYFLNSAQKAAAIYNGLRLDPDGNSTGVLQVIPEPSAFILISVLGCICISSVLAKKCSSLDRK